MAENEAFREVEVGAWPAVLCAKRFAGAVKWRCTTIHARARRALLSDRTSRNGVAGNC